MTKEGMKKVILSAKMPSCILPPISAPAEVWEEEYLRAVTYSEEQARKASESRYEPQVKARQNNRLNAAIIRGQMRKERERGSIASLAEEKEHGYFNYRNI